MFDVFILSFLLFVYLLKKQRPNDYIKSKVLGFAIIYGGFSTFVSIYMSPSAFIFYKGQYELLTQFEEEYLFPYSSVLFGGLVPVWGTYFYGVTFYRANTDPEGFVKNKKRLALKKKCLNENKCSSYLEYLGREKDWLNFKSLYDNKFTGLSFEKKCRKRRLFYEFLKNINMKSASEHANLFLINQKLRSCPDHDSFELAVLLDRQDVGDIVSYVKNTKSSLVVRKFESHLYNEYIYPRETLSDDFKLLLSAYKVACKKVILSIGETSRMSCERLWETGNL